MFARQVAPASDASRARRRLRLQVAARLQQITARTPADASRSASDSAPKTVGGDTGSSSRRTARSTIATPIAQRGEPGVAKLPLAMRGSVVSPPLRPLLRREFGNPARLPAVGRITTASLTRCSQATRSRLLHSGRLGLRSVTGRSAPSADGRQAGRAPCLKAAVDVRRSAEAKLLERRCRET